MFGQSQSLVMGFSQGAGLEGSPAKVAKQEDKQTCLPMTIRGIEAAVQESGNEFKVNGVEHGMLVLVGLVETVTKQATSMELSLSDGTGRIKAKYYITDTSSGIEEIVAGRYVSAFGNMRTSPTPHFVMTGVRVVQSADEISYHMIESAHAALKLKQGVLGVVAPSPQKAAVPSSTQPVVPQASAPVAKPVAAPSSQAALAGPALRTAIADFLRAGGESHPEGLALDAVLAHVKATPAEHVRKALEGLVDDGEVFTTIDDEHFSCV